MKKRTLILLAVVAVILPAALSGCTSVDPTWEWKSEAKAEKRDVTINVYNWGEYIAHDTIAAFEYTTGIKVNYSTFDDNEKMYAKFVAGTADYDVIFPSDYMIGKMINEGRLLPLDFNNIPNYEGIDEGYKNLNYDPENTYSVPYTWGTVGIFYNKKFVQPEELTLGWDLLWSTEHPGKIVMFSNPRDAFGIALKKLGYSMNTEVTAEWDAAYAELEKQKDSGVIYRWAMDEIYDIMIAEDAHIGPYYAGDAMIMMDEKDGNPNIDFFFPEEGINWFIDAMCVPVGARHKAEAEEFINFMCRTEVAKANCEAIGYSTPHTGARGALDKEIGENPNFYPPESVMSKAEMFKTMPKSIDDYMTELWNQLKID